MQPQQHAECPEHLQLSHAQQKWLKGQQTSMSALLSECDTCFRVSEALNAELSLRARAEDSSADVTELFKLLFRVFQIGMLHLEAQQGGNELGKALTAMEQQLDLCGRSLPQAR